MDEKIMLESRVWGRILGEKSEERPQNSQTAAYLSAECAALCIYRKMVPNFPGVARCLVALAKENIKYLKAQNFVETGRNYYEKTLENLCFPCWKDALRHRILMLQKMPKTGPLGCNWEKQQRLLLGLLGTMV